MNDNLDAALAGLELDDAENEAYESNQKSEMTLFEGVPLTVTLEVANTEITLGELSQAKHGDVLRLDKEAGQPLDVKVNGVYFAKAEVVMVEGQYGLKFISEDNSSTQEA
ncbi:FliM/FliN family flagellar motor switch protein [Pseudoalteromonas shioyasakiensis]|uniref:FliM/FliN family flagellar motor switch protein n=1 Tax=Pseudoalteromonas shioyasakiensis TaxID=1190813 RepID=UPI0021186FA8|nr:FliM/FliN family flagellar motor switch protein [Pseudoalteromonas shioyasakiensis]MCQ8877495.1 FliM/FliN family flagellar motor switch protein [Pseudoalteromonas shioyasakiensis]